MNYFRILAICPALALGVAASLPAHGQALSPETFRVMDIDENGKVDRSEHAMAMGAAFAHADGDADGILDADEAAVLNLPPQVDADGDGQITLSEFLDSARRDFEAADQDGDGILLP